jgi:Tol biopolymer transport system component
MALTAGTRLGPYEIVGPLGAGGMGEVYRARDTRLNRDVAIKVLPESFAADPDPSTDSAGSTGSPQAGSPQAGSGSSRAKSRDERRARFEREAQAIAALSHPNILAIFDTGVNAGQLYVVTELLEGETLRDALKIGALPVRKAVDIAVQIAHGLGAAHDKHIVHRDLKPENVFLLEDGQVKILDFGLARQVATGTGATGTVAAMTDPGTVMGTVGYMAPEQVRGQAVDARTDLFALGAVLYEMLSGQRAFRRDTAADTMFAIVKEDPPDLLTARADLSPALDRIVRHCLEKNPNERFQTARDVAFALGGLPGSGPSSPREISPRVARPSRAWRLRLAIAALCLLVAALAWAGWRLSRPGAAPLVVRFIQPPPEDMSIGQGAVGPPGAIAVSPDGSRIAFVGYGSDGSGLWLRRLDQTTATLIEGTRGAKYPFWSADGQFLAFCDATALKKVPRDGGTPQPIASCSNPRSAGAWAHDNTIMFVPQYDGPLVRVSASGATAPEALSMRAPTGWIRHLVFLPDGERFLFVLRGDAPNGEDDGVFVGSTRAPETQRVIKGRSNGLAMARGSLFFTQNGTLVSAPFDAGSATLTGEVTQIAPNVAAFSASEAGSLAYFATPRGINLSQQIAWFSRDGTRLKTTGDPGTIVDPQISPDGLQLAVARRSEGGVADLWTYDVARDAGTRVTFNGGVEPVWSRDGGSLLYLGGTAAGIHRVSLGGDATAGPMPGMPTDAEPQDWSRNTRFVAVRIRGSQDDLLIVPAEGGTAIPVGITPFSEGNGRFSPDSRWIAYVSNESGGNEVYVKPVPGPGPQKQVSTGGGDYPVWDPDGKEIYYRSPESMLTAQSVNGSGSTFVVVGTPQTLFKMTGVAWNFLFDTHDGKQFVMVVPSERDPSPLTVVVNWTPPTR